MNELWDIMYKNLQGITGFDVFKAYYEQDKGNGFRTNQKRTRKSKMDLIAEETHLDTLYKLVSQVKVEVYRKYNLQCKDCNGEGIQAFERPIYNPDNGETNYIWDQYPCPTCEGTGKEKKL